MASATGSRTTVIGLGNPLMGDDGVGLQALARLREDWLLPDDVALVDGGTWGISLLPDIEDADRLLLLDAVDRGMPPGTEAVLGRDEIPRALALKVSPHQVDLREVIALAELRGTLPAEVVLVGLQPERVVFGDGLSPRVEGALDKLVDTAVCQLELWGHRCVARRRRACTR
jgi:hydrogenase maturation protease